MKKLTRVHKIRLFIGIHGDSALNPNYYYFNIPKWGGLKTQKILYKFMFYVGNPLLNLILRGPAFKND